MHSKLFALITLVLLGSTMSSSAIAQDCALCVGRENTEINRIATIASEIDFMQNFDLPAVGPNEHRTRFGAVVTDTCLRGFSPARRAARISRIEMAMARSIAQLRTCQSSLHFAEIPDVISVLRRTRFSCSDSGPRGHLASMEIMHPVGGKSGYLLTSSSTHHFDMDLASVGPSRQPAPGDREFENYDLEDFAALLAHEAMHTLAMNNREWHNNMASRAKSGCANTRFEDRIYFTEAACFPRSLEGRAFYSGAFHRCPGLCQRALTEVDESLRSELSTQGPLPSGRARLVGVPVLARPYPQAEAERICSDVRHFGGRFPN